ncbi:MAG: hypothetical protein JNJ63_10645 [Hyphomonadaceae bacterium]|nr:hypothetical protein [Hyphomonadaceae bacterium]
MPGILPNRAEKREKCGFLAQFEEGAVTLHQRMTGIQSNIAAAESLLKAAASNPSNDTTTFEEGK